MTAEEVGVRLETGPDGVSVLRWRRGGRRNAFDHALVEALSERLEELRRKPPAALVLYGADGDFSAGADLADVRALADGTRGRALDYSRRVQDLTAAVEAVPAPSAAAIEGVCMGLGLEIALAATVRVAASDARLGLPEMAHGLYPAAGGTARLPEAVGEGRARTLILEGRTLSAREAHELGLVERLSDPGGALSAGVAWARQAAPTGQAAVRLLAARRVARGEAFERALEAEREGFADLVRTAAVRERLDAFLAARRKPQGGAAGRAGPREGAWVGRGEVPQWP